MMENNKETYQQERQWYDKIEDFEDDCTISAGNPAIRQNVASAGNSSDSLRAKVRKLLKT